MRKVPEANAEIDAIRAILAFSPRRGVSARRKRLDALGGRYPLPEDVHVEAADAGGVAAERTVTPEAEGALAKVGAFIRSHFG